jgi:hypothetical protein
VDWDLPIRFVQRAVAVHRDVVVVPLPGLVLEQPERGDLRGGLGGHAVLAGGRGRPVTARPAGRADALAGGPGAAASAYGLSR